ncbi:hypothetical protein LTR56_002910 [Elasticomyces elasticus]|nr:hypothetical protein LTR56_002910 [Elasticomyces elasticus]KAK3665131.1 hypothetical protein LTR22_003937 [Elasticomyces elasticus]KAK4930696.1 hypothetical protein LTR49_002784 [Elasticomyces elasticus]KAK5759919.1 hypothetical protein LTS12_009967 [Elasticomyces elasticus]
MAKMAKGKAIAESPKSTTTSKISKGQHKARHNKKTAGDHKGEKPARRARPRSLANAKAPVAAASISDSNTEGSIECQVQVLSSWSVEYSAVKPTQSRGDADNTKSAPITHDADRVPEVESNAVVIQSPEVESSVVSAAPTIVKTQAEETTQIDVSAPVPASSSSNISALAGAACPVTKSFKSKRHDPEAKARAAALDAEENRRQYGWLDNVRPQIHPQVLKNKKEVRERQAKRKTKISERRCHNSPRVGFPPHEQYEYFERFNFVGTHHYARS